MLYGSIARTGSEHISEFFQHILLVDKLRASCDADNACALFAGFAGKNARVGDDETINGVWWCCVPALRVPRENDPPASHVPTINDIGVFNGHPSGVAACEHRGNRYCFGQVVEAESFFIKDLGVTIPSLFSISSNILVTTC